MQYRQAMVNCGRLLASLALVTALATFSFAQPEETTKLTKRHGIDSAAQSRRDAIRARDSVRADTSTGWLILDGELIPRPYVGTVQDSLVLINGIVVYGEGYRLREQEPTVDSLPTTSYEVSTAMLERFRQWYADSGIAIARQKALEFMQRQPIVDTAYLSSESILILQYKGKEWPEQIWLEGPQAYSRHMFSNMFLDNFRLWYADSGLDVAHRKAFRFMKSQPLVDSAFFVSKGDLSVWYKGAKWADRYILNTPRTRSVPQSDFLREKARTFHDRLMVQLKTGGLVIMENGRHLTIYYPRSAIVVNQLKEISARIGDVETRAIAVQKVIGKEWPTKRIAERFMQK